MNEVYRLSSARANINQLQDVRNPNKRTYYIMYQHDGNHAPEIIDEAPTKAQAVEYLEEYRMAYGPECSLWTTAKPQAEALAVWNGEL